jgi:crossover junction endodeoxyribonuclease RuvC
MQTPRNTKVLGIDPGFGRIGWAIVEGNRSAQTLVEYGCIETNAKSDVPSRLLELSTKLTDIITKHQPEVGVVEELYFFKNQKTVMQVAQARGAIVVALKLAGLGVVSYTPLQVKQSVSGYGRADKHQVQEMVKRILHLKTIPQPDDAADAVAVALTHLFTSSFA